MKGVKVTSNFYETSGIITISLIIAFGITSPFYSTLFLAKNDRKYNVSAVPSRVGSLVE